MSRLWVGIGCGALVACGNDAAPKTEVPPETVEPVACLAADAVDFGEVRLADGPVTASVALANDCTAGVLVQEIRLSSSASGRAFRLVDAPSGRTVVNPGEVVAVDLQVEPTSYGPLSDELEIRSNADDNPVLRVAVSAAVVCESVASDVDTDTDGIPDGCDVCAAGDDGLDADVDTVPDACDTCPGEDDTRDFDLDGVPNACDICLGSDDRLDADADAVPDGCDICALGDDALDADLDTVPDACDACPDADDRLDEDSDGVPDACDQCEGFDDAADVDGDGAADGCDPCPTGAPQDDSDADGVPDACDACPNFDDAIDTDNDTVPDDCDVCPGVDDLLDGDLDTVPDGCDVCSGRDDLADADADGIADGCDRCPAGDDVVDSDNDSVPDACDVCPSFDDLNDRDLDGRPDDCDSCVGPSRLDAFPAIPPPAVDILFVVDDSCSISGDPTDGLGAWISHFDARGIDWQWGVLGMSSGTLAVGFPDANGLPTVATQLVSCSPGPVITRGIDRAWQSTQPGGVASSFVRLDALLVIVFVNASSDTSTLVTSQQAYNHWVQLKGGIPGRVAIHAVSDGGYDQLVALAGGVDASIGSPPVWNDIFAALQPPLGNLAPSDLLLPLVDVPVPDTILVQASGTPVRRSDWLFEASTNSVRVRRDGFAAGSFLSVDYVIDCEGVFRGCSDGVDNDGDGKVDWPDEPGCDSPFDANEIDPVVAPRCSNGIDDDGDGTVDYPDDARCLTASGDSEVLLEIDLDAAGYRLTEGLPPALPCPDLSATGPGLSLGDEGTALVPLGFAFDFYGTPYTEVYVGANGTLHFEEQLSPPLAECLPSSQTEGAILPYWSDLDTSNGGIWTRTAGAAPNRAFEVQWLVLPGPQPSPVDIRAVLSENSGDIEVCYGNRPGGSTTNLGADAVTGIQAPVGTHLEYTCQQSTVQQGTVLRYEAP